MTDKILEKIEEKFMVPEHISDKIKNVVESVSNGYVLYETRPVWDNNDKPWTKTSVAKIVFTKKTNTWKLYWMRASGKWELYCEAKSLDFVLNEIEDDMHGCFWGQFVIANFGTKRIKDSNLFFKIEYQKMA